MATHSFVRLHEERVRTLQKKVRDQAIPCHICDEMVHPANVTRHLRVHHSGVTLTKAIKPKSALNLTLLHKFRNAYKSDSHIFLNSSYHSVGTAFLPPATSAPTEKVIQMPLMPDAQILDHHTDTLAYYTIDLIQAALAGDYQKADQALANIQHTMHRATQGDATHRNDYAHAVEKSVICSEWHSIIKELAS